MLRVSNATKRQVILLFSIYIRASSCSTNGEMDESSDVFQDFGSDGSDFDDDADWNFTDGESASILQLMSGANSTKKAQVAGTATNLPLTAVKDTLATTKDADCISTDAVKVLISDEDLLDELFPEGTSEFTSKVEKSTELQVEEEYFRKKECEVEWAFMALEEHEQLGRQSRSVSPTKGDADFVSLFEEMYSDDTAVALSTPSPPAKLGGDQQEHFNTKHLEEQEVVDAGDVPKVDGGVDELLPADIIAMLQLVYKKGVETHRDFALLAKDTCTKLQLPSHACGSEPFCSFDSCVRAICSLEENLNSQDLVKSFAPTYEERLELIIVALDDKIGALPQTLKIKWAKVIDMLPLLVKMREQVKPSVPVPNPTDDQPTALQIKTMTPPPVNAKDKKCSPMQGWATFHPEKMPVRRCESMKIPKTTSKSSSSNPRVQIRQYLPSKLRVRCKVYNPEDSELTFRPKINKKSLQNGKGDFQQPRENFTTRMERDISLRRSQKLQLEQQREQQEREETGSVSTVKLIAKGSERILLKNGMWTESLEERLHRLAKHRTNVELGDSRSKKRRHRHEKRKREAAAVALRACESLYQRGIEQRRREQERLQEDNLNLEFQRNRPKMSSRSLRVMKTRIREELAQLCLDSQGAEALDDDDESSRNNLSFVTFIQFSCALLYFGFVVDLNTPWEDSIDDNSDNKVTLLWYSWTVFTRDDSGEPGSKLAMKVLERVLFSVILGGRAGNHSVLRGKDAQVLLRMYRANYYARKHIQFKEEPSDKQNTSNTKVRQTKEGQTKKRGSSQRQRIRYTLHGKPIRNNIAPETDLLSEREQLLQEKIDQMREEKMKQELEGCTFHPQINPGPSKSVAMRSARQSSPPKSFATVSTFERLYSDAFQRQNNVLEKYLEAKLHREELEKRECRVFPSYVNGLSIEERLENLHVALASNALPVDFHKKIDAIRTATEMKALDEQIKEQRLQPAQFKKAKDGRTIVLPFQFATEIRAAMNTKLKKQRTKAAHRPRDYVMKGVRPLVEEQVQGVQAPVHSPQVIQEDNDCSEAREADLCLDVHLSPSETRQLYLNVHDNPREVVELFAQRFSLTNTQRHFLIQMVEARLEQFTSYSSDNH